MQVNVQFLQQLQPEWSRFVTVVKQRQEIDTVSYHKLFDVLKQFQNEVNDIRSERLARSANLIALLACVIRHKGKEIAKPVTPQSESVSEEDSDQNKLRGIRICKGLALLVKQFGNHTDSDIAGVGNSRLVLEIAGKPSGLRLGYHEEEGDDVQQVTSLNHQQYSSWPKIQEVSPAESSSTDTPLEQVQNHDENDVFANVRRHSEQPESINDTYVLEKDDSNVIPDSSNICTNDNQVTNAV
ncbi:hypothetical protein Tco_0899103 [Tanacetum coccineum]